VSTAKRKELDEEQGYEQRALPGAHDQVILALGEGSRWALRYGLAGAEVRKRFLRPLQDSLDSPTGNDELLSDNSDGLPDLEQRKDAIPKKGCWF
jgi:hypothetical protein